MPLPASLRIILPVLPLCLLSACPRAVIPTPEPPGPCEDSAPSASQAPTEKFVPVPVPVPGEYIVVLQEPPQGEVGVNTSLVAQNLVELYGGNVFLMYETALRGFAIRMSEEQARKLAQVPQVKYVQQNGVVTISGGRQAEPTWGIDRVDQRDLPLDQVYQYGSSGQGVHAYIIDTGIRFSHQEFAGRAEYGFDAVGDGQEGNDCNGHGTHVAGTVGGNTYGVAKGVRLHAVRVLDCRGSGTTAGVIAGVDWVTENRQLPAVANMSLGGGASPALDDAVRRSIAAGVTYVLAAGNENQDACRRSPARTREAVTVGATTDADERASFSNWGSCVDVFAPGHQITSAWHSGDDASRSISGTSMAAPHVAGVVALYLQNKPAATPSDVAAALSDSSTPGKVANAGRCSANRLAYSGFMGGNAPPAPTATGGPSR
jgi:subtilisin family serine protease